MTQCEREQEVHKRALAHYRDSQFATWLTAGIGLAALTHPEEIRKALASVFSLEAVEKATEAAVLRLNDVLAACGQARVLLHTLQEDVNAAIARLDAVSLSQEKLELMNEVA